MDIDWIEGTITGKGIETTLAEVESIVGGAGWIALEHGGYGYECSAVVLDTGRVYWSNVRPGQGVHVSLPSSAIAMWCQKGDPRELLLQLSRAGLTFTRLDFAFDDKSRLLNMGKIGELVESRSYASRFRKVSQVRSRSSGRWGVTWNFGARVSESYVRIYDKAAEQDEPGDWIRVEMELKSDRADQAGRYLLFNTAAEDWAKVSASWLLGVLDFKQPGADSNHSRWDTVSWWSEFLGVCEKAGLGVPKEVRTVDQLREWVRAQVSPTLYVLLWVFGQDEMLRLVGQAAERLRPKHLAMMAA